jgi:energy-coupling factor transporter ATP-binding protein EcfA2
LLGPNGAGKTTFLDLISSRIFADSGDIKLFGQNAVENQKILPKLCYMPEKNLFITTMRVSVIIDKVKNSNFIEGVFYICRDPAPTINLAIVYNDYKFHYDYSPSEKRSDILTTDGLNLKIDTILFQEYFREQRKIERAEYPIKLMLRYGNILYDKHGNLAKLKQQLETDAEIESSFDYWLDAYKFEPPLQVIKK